MYMRISDRHTHADIWMDGWMDGWVDGWMDGWMDGWIDMSTTSGEEVRIIISSSSSSSTSMNSITCNFGFTLLHFIAKR